MPDHEHKKIIETIARLDAPPYEAQSLAEWIKANAHLVFLRDNADADEVVVYALGEYSFIRSSYRMNGCRLPIRTTSYPGIAMPTRRLPVTSPVAAGKCMAGAWHHEHRHENAARRTRKSLEQLASREAGVLPIQWRRRS
jgi:hypothetical protein